MEQPSNNGLVTRLLQRLSGSANYSQIDSSDWYTDRPSQDRWSPEEDAGLWSKLTYTYASGLIKLGYSQPLQQEHLWDMAHNHEAVPLTERFHAALDATRDPVRSPHVSIITVHMPTHPLLTIKSSGSMRPFHPTYLCMSPHCITLEACTHKLCNPRHCSMFACASAVCMQLLLVAIQGRVLRALWAVHWPRLATAAGCRLLQNLCAWTGPFLLQQLLAHLQAGAAMCKLTCCRLCTLAL